MGVNGVLNINKPPGLTSFDVVRVVRRLSGEKRVGHAGTLDPIATGVLVLCLGQATRVIEYLATDPKVYLAKITLGISTDTYDAEGLVTEQRDTSHLTKEQVETALLSFLGTIEQTPPPYSAVKQQGKKLYELARAGVAVKPKARHVQVFRIDFKEWQPPSLTLEIECGRGTYIRSIAHDLGQALGCGGHLSALTRLRSGVFDIADSIGLDQLRDAFEGRRSAVAGGDWQKVLLPMDWGLRELGTVTVDEEQERRLRHGQSLQATAMISQPDPSRLLYRAYSPSGQLIAILRFDAANNLLHPEKVFQQ